MKFEQHQVGLEASEEKSFGIIYIFSIQMHGAHINAYGSKLDLSVKILGMVTILVNGSQPF